MTLENIKVGDKYRVKPKFMSKCWSATYEVRGAFNGGYIVVTKISTSGGLYYDIMDKLGKKLSSCAGCYKPEHLEPYEEEYEKKQEAARTLKVGDRVQGEADNKKYTGTVYSVHGDSATIRRDDRKRGGGDTIEDYGGGWSVTRKGSGSWGGSDTRGNLTVINSTPKEVVKKMVDVLRNALLDKDTRLLIKAGLYGPELNLTATGKEVALELSAKDDKEKMVAVAKGILAERAKNNK